MKILSYNIYNFFQIFYRKDFKGWGRKKTGRLAVWCHKKFGGNYKLLEDGFIRSVGLGIDNSPSFSWVEDDIGIYYDATVPSKLENILNTYDFANDTKLMSTAKKAIELILKHNISKYNDAPIVDDEFCKRYDLDGGEILKQVQDDYKVGGVNHCDKNILIITQTAGDSSLEYGLANQFSTVEIINTAIKENPNRNICLKIHPDVLTSKKKSDISINEIPSFVKVISENVNPISLLKYFDKVYTKTSGMGFEALLMGCECVCFGMPFYAGWGITDDRIFCDRRVQNLSIEEVFAAAYILYTRYVNPYTKENIDIIETINTIIKKKSSRETS